MIASHGKTRPVRSRKRTGASSWARKSKLWPSPDLRRPQLTRSRYQRAFVDFFEDQLVAFGYDWKALVAHYMYDGKQPLINSVVSGRESHLLFVTTTKD